RGCGNWYKQSGGSSLGKDLEHPLPHELETETDDSSLMKTRRRLDRRFLKLSEKKNPKPPQDI
ncbi:hypothetical protein LINPERPRIM_LOCUS27443, partial [Linum perenne]